MAEMEKHFAFLTSLLHSGASPRSPNQEGKHGHEVLFQLKCERGSTCISLWSPGITKSLELSSKEAFLNYCD